MKKEKSTGKAKSRAAAAKPQQNASRSTKGYQPQYEPCTLTESEERDVKQMVDRELCNREVERVTRNIAAAIANPETPEIVRAHIRAYLDNHFYYDWTQEPEMILCLYPIHCRKLSQIPFVPLKEHIEALTGNNKSAAMETTKTELDYAPHKSIAYYGESE